MHSRKKIIFWIFLAVLDQICSFKIDDPGQAGVVFDAKTSNTQPIYVDENNDGSETILALIADVEKNLSFTVQSGDENGLNPYIKAIDDGSFQLIGVRLDFERLVSYIINIEIFEIDSSSSSEILTVHIVNLDDEPPALAVTVCQIEEETSITVDNSNCVFQVSDPDGWLGYTTFDILDNEEALFQFVYKNVPENNTKHAEVSLVLTDNKKLDYESVNIYSFIVQVKDLANHPTTQPNLTVVVQVIDIPDQPPIWVSSPTTARITEETPTDLTIFAKDGDTGIANVINYRIEDDPTGLIQVDSVTGLISIGAIDRDLDNDVITFTVVAYEAEDEASIVTQSITLMIDDLDDNIPEIVLDGSTDKFITTSIKEGASEISVTLNVIDKDLGENAIYTVYLKSSGDIDYSSAFEVTPARGYGTSSVTLIVTDPSLLDFEDKNWRNFTLELHTEGVKTPDNSDTFSITINLLDINDEAPQFKPVEYAVEISENAISGTVLANIKATDLDAEDIEVGVKHEILGKFSSILKIDEVGGNITVVTDDAFNYEKQNEIFVQIRAEDANGHAALALLIIKVTDVNDEKPKLSVSSAAITIAENQADGFVFDLSITATDEDSSANLEFSIDWQKSYATKNSVRLADFKDFENFVRVETSGELILSETVPSNTPDYEIFDTFYLQLLVTDKNTEMNEDTDSALLIINIENINDNSPVFSDDNNSIKRMVTENCENETYIGIMTAEDLDGDSLTYSIAEPEDETPLWIGIDGKTGTVFVNLQEGEQIDCDQDDRSNLMYTVIATDGVHTASLDITIDIIDQNDNVPTLTYQNPFIIPEDDGNLNNIAARQGQILILQAQDLDRDEPFNTVSCSFSTSTPSEVLEKFLIEQHDTNFDIKVKDNVTLNFEEQQSYIFSLDCFDNPSGKGSFSNPIRPSPEVVITLMDINDNSPTIITADVIKISENEAQGSLSQKIIFEDKDGGANGMMNFEITQIQRFLDEKHENEATDVSQTLFGIESDNDKKSAILNINEGLQGNFGYFDIKIKATDMGTPSLSTDTKISLEVVKYNYKEPVFNFPEDGEKYQLSRDQSVNTTLKLFDGSDFKTLKANDDGQNKYNVKFKITKDCSGLFAVSNEANSEGELILLTTDIDYQTSYKVTITAYLDTDNIPTKDEAPYDKECTVTFNFSD